MKLNVTQNSPMAIQIWIDESKNFSNQFRTKFNLKEKNLQ